MKFELSRTIDGTRTPNQKRVLLIKHFNPIDCKENTQTKPIQLILLFRIINVFGMND